MADNTWITKIQSIVLTRIKKQFPTDLLTKYSMTKDNFSTVSNSTSKPLFPFVYVSTLPGSEILSSLEGDTINGVDFALQIDVIDNRSNERASKVMNEIILIMKSMKFRMNVIPTFDNTIDEYRTTVTFQRKIGASDKL